MLIKMLMSLLLTIVLLPIVCNERINKFKQTVLASHGHNPLIQAICADDILQVKNLLDKGVDINVPNNNNLTPLAIAVGCENKEIVQLLLHNGANINSGLVLLEAIKIRCMPIAVLLLEHGVNANETSEDKHNITPLMYAVASNLYDITLIELLLKKGANINARCDSRVMNIYSSFGYCDYAYDCSGRKSNKLGSSVLMHAMKNDIDLIKLLLEKGAEVNLPFPDNSCYWGKMPLVQALKAPNAFELVSLLLSYGADVNVSYDGGATPLIGAIQDGVDSKVIKLLLDNGAHVSVQDTDGYNPLMYAVARNDVQIVQLLLEKNADLTTKSSMTVVFSEEGKWQVKSRCKESPEKTALDIARENRNQTIVQLLEEKIFGQKQ